MAHKKESVNLEIIKQAYLDHDGCISLESKTGRSFTICPHTRGWYACGEQCDFFKIEPIPETRTYIFHFCGSKKIKVLRLYKENYQYGLNQLNNHKENDK